MMSHTEIVHDLYDSSRRPKVFGAPSECLGDGIGGGPLSLSCRHPSRCCPLLPAAARCCPLLPAAARCCPLLPAAARCCCYCQQLSDLQIFPLRVCSTSPLIYQSSCLQVLIPCRSVGSNGASPTGVHVTCDLVICDLVIL